MNILVFENLFNRKIENSNLKNSKTYKMLCILVCFNKTIFKYNFFISYS